MFPCQLVASRMLLFSSLHHELVLPGLTILRFFSVQFFSSIAFVKQDLVGVLNPENMPLLGGVCALFVGFKLLALPKRHPLRNMLGRRGGVGPDLRVGGGRGGVGGMVVALTSGTRTRVRTSLTSARVQQDTATL